MKGILALALILNVGSVFAAKGWFELTKTTIVDPAATTSNTLLSCATAGAADATKTYDTRIHSFKIGSDKYRRMFLTEAMYNAPLLPWKEHRGVTNHMGCAKAMKAASHRTFYFADNSCFSNELQVIIPQEEGCNAATTRVVYTLVSDPANECKFLGGKYTLPQAASVTFMCKTTSVTMTCTAGNLANAVAANDDHWPITGTNKCIKVQKTAEAFATLANYATKCAAPAAVLAPANTGEVNNILAVLSGLQTGKIWVNYATGTTHNWGTAGDVSPATETDAIMFITCAAAPGVCTVDSEATASSTGHHICLVA